jgi:dynein heavy chain
VIALEIAQDLASKTPELLLAEQAAFVTFEMDGDGTVNSLGTFLQIEMLKFNKLLANIKSSLTELQRAIKGTVVMSKELDSMRQSLLLQRVPTSFWMSAFFFSQGYMTAALQMYARSIRIPIDTLDFATHVLKTQQEDVTDAAGEGVYFYGAFIEGCRWDTREAISTFIRVLSTRSHPFLSE